MTTDFSRLRALRGYIVGSTNAYYRATDRGGMPSTRILGWLDEYNELMRQAKTSDLHGWIAYCDETRSSYEHDSFDLLA